MDLKRLAAGVLAGNVALIGLAAPVQALVNPANSVEPAKDRKIFAGGVAVACAVDVQAFDSLDTAMVESIIDEEVAAVEPPSEAPAPPAPAEPAPPPEPEPAPAPPPLPAPPPGSWLTEEHMANAAVIVSVGREMGLSTRAHEIAVATAIQESKLRNLGHLGAANDSDSQGLFQQRPSMGWGTPEQVTDPAYASRKFYERLLSVGGWESMSLSVAAQSVQRSAFPDAYAQHEGLAQVIVAAFG